MEVDTELSLNCIVPYPNCIVPFQADPELLREFHTDPLHLASPEEHDSTSPTTPEIPTTNHSRPARPPATPYPPSQPATPYLQTPTERPANTVTHNDPDSQSGSELPSAPNDLPDAVLEEVHQFQNE